MQLLCPHFLHPWLSPQTPSSGGWCSTSPMTGCKLRGGLDSLEPTINGGRCRGWSPLHFLFPTEAKPGCFGLATAPSTKGAAPEQLRRRRVPAPVQCRCTDHYPQSGLQKMLRLSRVVTEAKWESQGSREAALCSGSDWLSPWLFFAGKQRNFLPTVHPRVFQTGC